MERTRQVECKAPISTAKMDALGWAVENKTWKRMKRERRSDKNRQMCEIKM